MMIEDKLLMICMKDIRRFIDYLFIYMIKKMLEEDFAIIHHLQINNILVL